MEQVWRWSRRHRALATLSALVVLAVALAAITGWWGWSTTRSALARERDRKQEAQRAQGVAEREAKRARGNLGHSLEALESIFDALAGSDLVLEADVDSEDEDAVGMLSSPPIGEREGQLLRRLLPFYDRLAEENATEERVVFDAAQARRRAGQIFEQLGQLEDAEQAYERSLRRFREIDPKGLDDLIQVEVAATLNELGELALLRPSRIRKEATEKLKLSRTILVALKDPERPRHDSSWRVVTTPWGDCSFARTTVSAGGRGAGTLHEGEVIAESLPTADEDAALAVAETGAQTEPQPSTERP